MDICFFCGKTSEEIHKIRLKAIQKSMEYDINYVTEKNMHYLKSDQKKYEEIKSRWESRNTSREKLKILLKDITEDLLLINCEAAMQLSEKTSNLNYKELINILVSNKKIILNNEKTKNQSLKKIVDDFISEKLDEFESTIDRNVKDIKRKYEQYLTAYSQEKEFKNKVRIIVKDNGHFVSYGFASSNEMNDKFEKEYFEEPICDICYLRELKILKIAEEIRNKY
jgi:hypothetical protein